MNTTQIARKEKRQAQKKSMLNSFRASEREYNNLSIEKNPALVSVGQALREKRTSRNLTAKQIEEITKIGFAHLYNIEGGKVNVTIDTLDKLARAMNCRLEINFVRNKAEEGRNQQ